MLSSARPEAHLTAHPRNVPSIDPQKLGRLAEIAVKVGLRLQPGQDLFLTAPVAALPLARRIAEEAYRAGAGLVTPIFSDEEMALARYRFGPDLSFDRAPGWLYEGVGKAFAANTARLAIVGEDPMLLMDADPAKVARANKANAIAYKPALEKIAGFDINWNIVAYPTLSWAKRVFPDDADETAVARLAEAVFSASRVGGDDPVAAWSAHNSALASRTRRLNEKRFHALHYSGPDTDLIIGLADGHEWRGGAATAKNGAVASFGYALSISAVSDIDGDGTMATVGAWQPQLANNGTVLVAAPGLPLVGDTTVCGGATQPANIGNGQTTNCSADNIF